RRCRSRPLWSAAQVECCIARPVRRSESPYWPPCLSELPDEADLGNELLSELLLHLPLCQRDQRADIRRRRASQVHDDIGMQVGDLRAADPRTLEATLVHQAAGANPLDLPEDGAR